MSRENLGVVRKRLRVRERSSRPLDQRLFLRFPRLVDPYARLIGRLPPTSRIRQAAVLRTVRLTAEPCYRGLVGNGEALSGWFEAWGVGRSEPVELLDLGDGLVVLGTRPARGQASGVPLSQEYAWVVMLKDGKLLRQQEYLHHAEALEAAGLRE